MPLSSHVKLSKVFHRSTMFTVRLTTTRYSIALTVVSATALAMLAASQTQGLLSAITIGLLLVIISAQFCIARYLTTQDSRVKRYHQLGRKLVHIKRLKKRDETVALKILNHIVNQTPNETHDATVWQRPFEDFSGDLAIACQSDCGKTYMLIADLTGHGISAAMGATPVASIFQATAKQGMSVEQIVIELNEKLTQLLPAGFFCCAAVAQCNNNQLTVCNAGLPDLLVVKSDGTITDRIESTQLPLGIESHQEDPLSVFTKTYLTSHQMYAFTDGLIEMQSANDELFDAKKLEHLIASQRFQGSRVPRIKSGFDDFIKGSPQSDDISIVEVKIC